MVFDCTPWPGVLKNLSHIHALEPGITLDADALDFEASMFECLSLCQFYAIYGDIDDKYLNRF